MARFVADVRSLREQLKDMPIAAGNVPKIREDIIHARIS